LLFGLRETGLQFIGPGLKLGRIDLEQYRSSLDRLIWHHRYCDFLTRDIRRHFARGHNEGSQRCQIVEQRHENREKASMVAVTDPDIHPNLMIFSFEDQPRQHKVKRQNDEHC
jgi:hypothetical protein